MLILSLYFFNTPRSTVEAQFRVVLLFLIVLYVLTDMFTPWLTWIHFTQILLAHIFKKVPIPHLTRMYYETKIPPLTQISLYVVFK